MTRFPNGLGAIIDGIDLVVMDLWGCMHDGIAAYPAALEALRQLKRAGVNAADVAEVIMGQILTAGHGQNPARQASIGAGCPAEVPAWGVNQLCGSGLRSVALGFQAVQNGDSAAVQYLVVEEASQINV